MLPGSEITFENGNLGIVAVNPDGICGLVSSAVVNGTFLLNKHYVVYSLKEAEALGIIPTVAGNYELHKTIREFYDEAGTGTELWIYGVAKTRTLDELIEDSRALIVASNSRVRFITCKYAPSIAEVATEEGLREGFPATLAAAQAIADEFTIEQVNPIFYIIEGYNFTGVTQDLVGFSAATNNRVCVMIGDTETRTGATASKGAAVGVLSGRIAGNRVNVSAGRVRSGALKPLKFYILDTLVHEYNVTAIHDKGFVTLRTHIRKSGYYISLDQMACSVDDDYKFLPNRRVIDKAYVLASGVITEVILDDLNLTNTGTLMPADAKALETEIERVIAQEMTANSELSADVTKKSDSGVKASIDLTEKVGTTRKIKGKIKVRPKGYAFWLEFSIGFDINS